MPALAGEVEQLKQRLALWDEVHARWSEYAETLRQVVRLASGRRVEEAISAVPYELVIEAEERRGRVYGPLAALEINLVGRVEFEPFIQSSLRTSEAWKLFAAVAEPVNDSRVPESNRTVTWHVLEVRLADIARLLERTRLELRRDLPVAQARLDAASAAPEPTLRRLLEKWRRQGSVLARAVLWLVGDRLRAWVVAALTAALGALWYWLSR